MRHSFGKHHVVEHEDQGLIRPKSGTGVPPLWECRFSGEISRRSTQLVLSLRSVVTPPPGRAGDDDEIDVRMEKRANEDEEQDKPG